MLDVKMHQKETIDQDMIKNGKRRVLEMG